MRGKMESGNCKFGKSHITCFLSSMDLNVKKMYQTQFLPFPEHLSLTINTAVQGFS
jgi:hypothetical protein